MRVNEFTSRQTKLECIFALAYIPMHFLFVPLIIEMIFGTRIDNSMLNFVCYAVGAVFLLLTEWGFLKRDFNAFCEHTLTNIAEIAVSYGLMLACNMLVSIVLMILGSMTNPNNNAVLEMTRDNSAPIAATAIFLAPIIEEIMFRAGIFGLIRRYSRVAAYMATAIIFSVYHIWSYALVDPSNWIYFIQYIPVTLLLCRVYERTNSIWGSIFFHMMINFISMKLMELLIQIMP